MAYYFRNILDLQSNWCNQISIRRHDVLCQLCVDFLLVPAPSAVLFEVGLHIGIRDGGGPELLLTVVAGLVVRLWCCCCWWLCCCRHCALGGLRHTFVVVASKLV